MDVALRLIILIMYFGTVGLSYGEVKTPVYSQMFEELLVKKGKSTPLSFTGIFVFESSSQNTPFSIKHSAPIPGQTKISSIDGARFDVLLNTKTRAFHTNSRHLQIPAIQYDALLWSSMDFSDDFEKYYRLSSKGRQRICNRTADVIDINPIDNDKYSMRLFIDVDTGLILKKIILDDTYHVIETYSFVDLNVEKIPAKALGTDMPLVESYKNDKNNRRAVKNKHQFTLNWLPAGFNEVASSQQELDVVFQYSDGLFNTTIFLEPVDAKVSCQDKDNLQGGFSGYCKSVTLDKQVYQLTVTGNLPLETVKKIADNVNPENL